MNFALTANNVRAATCEITGTKCLCADITIDGPFPVAKTIDIRKLPEIVRNAAGMAQLAESPGVADPSPASRKPPSAV